MKIQKNVNLRLVESAYREEFKSLFAWAYLITANERKAESVMMKVMLSNTVPEEKDFDGIYSLVKEMAIKAASPEDSALFAFSGDMTEVKSPLAEWILTLDEKKARILTLKYAIHLSIKEICLVTGEESGRVKAVLERGKARARSQATSPKAITSYLQSAAGEAMNSACFPPDFSAILRSVERIIQDESALSERSFSVKPIFSYLTTAILMALIAIIVWMTVVLIDYYREPLRAIRPPMPIFTESPETTEG